MPLSHGRCVVYRGALFANHSGSGYCTTVVLRSEYQFPLTRISGWKDPRMIDLRQMQADT